MDTLPGMTDDTPRDRARRRLLAWAESMKTGTPRLTQEQMGQRIGWKQNEVSRMISRGPFLEELDIVSTMTGLPAAYFVAPENAAAPKLPWSEAERSWVELLRECSPEGQRSVLRFARMTANEEAAEKKPTPLHRKLKRA